ncbi:DNA mismatch repair protein MutS [Sodiomyces alkalinus F11]|uniref:DNA mismatch repair protein MutS n=1 Tax=Sodiomyces alkalinus (strain CBS 110278 / VKM F-3762 / F11) TaxID=1314773 RepID=A0A3N2PS07_SODAK|nr:DNA mismatch repair protein MutS [Sodiomyces alkalinus F11]ROT37302.1 DNA mismatch repair protein MutS [Sodiomyces alkalinus F11]
MLTRRLGASISLFDALLSPPRRSSRCCHSSSSVVFGNGPDCALRGRLVPITRPPVLPLAGFVPTTTSVRGKKTKTSLRIQDLPQGRVHVDAQPSTIPNSEDAAAAAAATATAAAAARSPAEPAEIQEPAYPTVLLQARRNMQKFANCVLLTRLGGFYELYFEQADELGPLLNLKVAQKKTNAGPVSMAGFPFFQLDRFLKILVQDLNRYVAVAEEFPNNAPDKIKSGGLMHDRRVARIITPGTLIDENFMDPYVNNFVLAIHASPLGETPPSALPAATPETKTIGPSPSSLPAAAALDSLPLGLAWLDLSTGQFFTQAADLSSLSSALSRISPREVVLDKDLQSNRDHGLFSVLAEDRHLVTYSPMGEMTSLADWVPLLESEIPSDTARAFTNHEVAAGSLLLHYVKDRLQGTSMKLQPPLRHEAMQIMSIDKNSMRALEVKQTIRDGWYRGSLLHAIRRTVTKSGTRLLNEWLSAPSTSLEVIESRQELVARFIAHGDLRDVITLLLRRTHDSQRLVQKFALGRGDPDDLLALAATVDATEGIANWLTKPSPAPTADTTADTDTDTHCCLSTMASRLNLEEPLKLARRIREAIDEEGIVHQHEIEDGETNQMMALAQDIISAEGSPDDVAAALPKGAAKKSAKARPTSVREHYANDNEAWVMRPSASPSLRRLHDELAALHAEKANLIETLRERHDAASLTLRWTPGLGHICHVRGKDARALAVADVGRSISASRSTRSFHLPEWTALGQRLDAVRAAIRVEEQAVFQALRESVVLNLVKLRRNAAVLDELDVATSFARLALEQGLSRPRLNHSTATTIIGGRHPTVEGGLREQGRSFVRNDCLVGSGSAHHGRLWLITGPNMGGKSTFLRQNALITILAQVGCYVPADYAELGLVDAIFSRVGSADNLYRHQSTFMVEMLETAQILRAATPRSFVIMDEIGRGTTPEDGAAVAFASLHHLVTVNKCRSLFATHFHSVADLAAASGLCGGPDSGGTGTGGQVEMYCTDVEEDETGAFVYVHKLRKGINRESHALKVARLAGLPEAAICVAKDVLEKQQTTLHTYEHGYAQGQHRSPAEVVSSAG